MHTTSTLQAQAKDVPAPYLAGILKDELRLARLLRWGNIDPPATLVPNFWIWGTGRGETDLNARLATAPLPRWRRQWGSAGELVARCGLSILQTVDAVAVVAGGLPPVYASFADFPVRDEAIFYAICHAAIGQLEAERAGLTAPQAAEVPA